MRQRHVLIPLGVRTRLHSEGSPQNMHAVRTNTNDLACELIDPFVDACVRTCDDKWDCTNSLH